jgi:uncharacterized membrane protein YdjX (TVP38/TMEM64 family)
MTTKVLKVPATWLERLRASRFAAVYKRRELWLLVGGMLLALLLWWLSEPFGAMMVRIGDLREWILTFGPMAPLVYIGIFSLQILVAPIPGQFLGVMGGYLFGVLLGSLYSITGLMVGASLAMWLARRLGRPLLERFSNPAQLAFWEKKMRMRAGLTWWLLFLLPMPDIVFYAAALSSASISTLLIALVAGRGLGLLLANTIGHWTAHSTPGWILVQWGVVGVLAVSAYLYERRLRLMALLTVRRLRHWWRRSYFFAR